MKAVTKDFVSLLNFWGETVSDALRHDCVRFSICECTFIGCFVQDLHGLAHKLPLMHDALKLSVAEMAWIVKVALKVSRSRSVGVTSLKRRPEAADLEDVVKSMPTDSQSLHVTICGPAKAAQLYLFIAKGTTDAPTYIGTTLNWSI